MAGEISHEDKESYLYLIQVRYLEENLERARLECDELEKENKDLVSQYDRLLKEDNNGNMKRSLTDNQKKVEELVDELEHQKKSFRQDREAQIVQHNHKMQELEETKAKLESKKMIQVAQLEEQEEQLRKLRQQLSEKESWVKKFINLEEEHKAVVHKLETDAVLKLEESIKMLQNSVETRVTTEASKILHRERVLSSQLLDGLLFLQNEVELRRIEKDAVQEKTSETNVEQDDLENEFSDSDQRRSILQKRVKQLRHTCRHLEKEIKDSNNNAALWLTGKDSLSQRLTLASDQCCQETAKLGLIQAELEKERTRIRELKGVKREAVIVLRYILLDTEDEAGTRLKMERLLDILESAAPKGTGSTLGDLAKKTMGRPKLSKAARKPGKHGDKPSS
ncbi:cilia- and flagella-associated protein 157-like [Mugil cephalus]|uniref:cilia- and flagella-associated protein 157-like n=1 Tax=Mugil cephalus TaxID=48193 RepID=UPI001FB60865|nr:cilia- and flagella-associated protein 157-like [Mugil cephalus]XP_047447515.1 cilia- and flagella-associated protein 157-like [Mugil cephalus]XP_047447516.1 cilia- and flagella-associated protein 157-like [Mugil cephalus]